MLHSCAALEFGHAQLRDSSRFFLSGHPVRAGWFPCFQRKGLWAVLGRLSRRFQQANATPVLFLEQLGLTLLTHLLAILAFYVLATGLGLRYPFSVCLILVPSALLLTTLPSPWQAGGCVKGRSWDCLF
ncbi:MAG: hypothetical protein HQQ73_00880 [Desulfobulbaceae bacterium]|nr:hypothetical protein [Desulfobulbaceae bacterium]